MRTIFLTRHGHRQDRVFKKWRSFITRPWDIPLSNLGISQAEEIAEDLEEKKLDYIFSSPFVRCVQTADIIGRRAGIDVHIEHGLCELLRSSWFEGNPDWLDVRELRNHYISVVDEHVSNVPRPTWPEGRGSCRKRVKATVDDLLKRYQGNLLLVGHGFSIKDAKVIFGGDGKLPPMGKLHEFSVGVENA